MNTELVTGDKTDIKLVGRYHCILQRCTFKQINTFTLVYRNELHNLFTDDKGCVS